MILLVGDRPSKRTDPDVPFKGAACEPRLKNWINNITKDIKEVRVVNTTSPHFLLAVIMAGMANIPIIALGNNASAALRKEFVPHFKLPHPSGRNRQINDELYIKIRLSCCRGYVKAYKAAR